LQSRFVANETKKWQEFASLFAKSKLTPCEYPGLGGIVSFKDHAAVVVADGCMTPQQYVAALEQRRISLEAQPAGAATIA
jgi:hypothetical protein